MACPPTENMAADEAATLVLEILRQHGACFVPDLAQKTGLSPGPLRRALWDLVRLGLVTNDSLDVIRRGEEKDAASALAKQGAARRPVRASALMRTRSGPRPRATSKPEGRWSLVPWGNPDVESQALLAAQLLLQRYGIVARELALMDERMPPWRVLYEVLSRLELAGDVRRGYFVEGLSGAQFALPEAIRQLQETGTPSRAQAPLVLLHSLDPANLFGTGAPLDIPLLEGGTRPFFRRTGNWLVLHAGRPVLLIEQHAKKLTTLASARPQDLAGAVALLPNILGKNQLRDIRHKMVVETWNEHPVTSTPGKDLLEAAGFVRDYQAMAWYAVWH
jgi:ATP-dependent helicase Lhr and Lhr-like helicase